MNRPPAPAAGRLDRLKDLVFKLNLAILVFLLVLGIVELVAWQLCRLGVSAHREMREPAYLDAYADLDDAEEHLANLRAAKMTLEYQPYCLWGLSEARTSTYNVLPDWGGIRKTVNVPKPAAAQQARVFLFGGSTVFCSRVPDRHTLASCLSASLNQRVADVEFSVTNFGRGGYLSDQEVVLLTQVLTAGEVPDLVILYDGTNETINKVCKGIPHYQYERFLAVETGAQQRTGLLQAALEYDQIGKLAGLIGGRPPEAAQYVTDKGQLSKNARSMAARYRQNAAFLRRLGEAYGFRTALFWQPDLLTTNKRLTEAEAGILENDAKARVWRPGFEIAHQAIRETMRDEETFCDLSHALDHLEGCLFFDVCHLSATANRTISDRIADRLAERGILKTACR